MQSIGILTRNKSYIGLVCKHSVAPWKIAVKCNSHHRQGVTVPSAKLTCILIGHTSQKKALAQASAFFNEARFASWRQHRRFIQATGLCFIFAKRMLHFFGSEVFRNFADAFRALRTCRQIRIGEVAINHWLTKYIYYLFAFRRIYAII